MSADPSPAALTLAASAPPSLEALADQCVQCGLCLPACPTYALEPLEAESPRGRIALAKAWATGALAASPTGDRHLDQCLGCRRCETVCPADVRYGQLLEATRQLQRRRHPPPWRQRAIEALTTRPKTLAGLLSAYRLAYHLLPAALRPLPRPSRSVDVVANQKSSSTATETVAVFTGCVARAYDTPMHAALVRLCAAVDIRVVIPTTQTCCGSLHAHGGDLDRAETLAVCNRSAFAETNAVLSLASGCHDAVARALRGQNSLIDAFEFLAQRRANLLFRPHHERIALHLPCTQRSVAKSDAALHNLLAQIPQLQIVMIDAGYGCCGAAGTQMLTEADRAARFRQPLLDQLAASGATRLLSANIGCRLHLANGTALPVQHPLEFLAECLA